MSIELLVSPLAKYSAKSLELIQELIDMRNAYQEGSMNESDFINKAWAMGDKFTENGWRSMMEPNGIKCRAFDALADECAG
jgi:hypothetical protein